MGQLGWSRLPGFGSHDAIRFAQTHGFLSTTNLDNIDYEYEALEKHWRRAIEIRRSAASY